VPVVAAAAGGPLDLVDHGRTGLLFDPVEPLSLWRAVAAVARDAALRASLATSAHEQVQGRSWPQLVRELVEHHYRAVQRGRRGVAAGPGVAA
jgi:phosphatidylinositol alpha 1,6-mannosyltransferase